jgi:hypothetical protein
VVNTGRYEPRLDNYYREREQTRANGKTWGGRGAIGTREITIRGARNSLKNLNKISEKTTQGK